MSCLWTLFPSYLHVYKAGDKRLSWEEIVQNVTSTFKMSVVWDHTFILLLQHTVTGNRNFKGEEHQTPEVTRGVGESWKRR